MSVVPEWRHHLVTPLLKFPIGSQVQIIDVSPSGYVSESTLQYDGSVSREDEKYKKRLENERQALKAETKHVLIKTRLVLFSGRGVKDFLLYDLYGLEFGIDPYFFFACTDQANDTPLFPEEDPPAFLNFGEGWCAKIIDQNFDHPLTRGGVTVSKCNVILARAFC